MTGKVVVVKIVGIPGPAGTTVDPADFVTKLYAQTITGIKTFSAAPIFSTGVYTDSITQDSAGYIAINSPLHIDYGAILTGALVFGPATTIDFTNANLTNIDFSSIYSNNNIWTGTNTFDGSVTVGVNRDLTLSVSSILFNQTMKSLDGLTVVTLLNGAADTLITDDFVIRTASFTYLTVDISEDTVAIPKLTVSTELDLTGATVTGLSFSSASITDLSISGTLTLSSATISGNLTVAGTILAEQEIISDSDSFVTHVKEINHSAYALPSFVGADASGTGIVDANDGDLWTGIDSANSAFKITLQPVTTIPANGQTSIKYLTSSIGGHSGYVLVTNNCYVNRGTTLTVPSNAFVQLISAGHYAGKINYRAIIINDLGELLITLANGSSVNGDLIVSGVVTASNYIGLSEPYMFFEEAPVVSTTYVLLLKLPYKIELLDVDYQVSSGTCTLSVRSNGVDRVTGLSVTTSLDNSSVTAGTYIEAGDNIEIYLTANTGAADLLVQVNAKRVE
jgi:uncharacterized protein YjbI with pentapeptide repeats